MPRRKPQPLTPDNLPELPQGATKKAYYPAGNLVYYLQDPDDLEWRKGEISDETTSTSLHVVIDEVTGFTFNVRAEYIRERPPCAQAVVPVASSRALSPDRDKDGTASQALQGGKYAGHVRSDSAGSEDPLAWSAQRYEQETTMGVEGLVDILDNTHMTGSSVTAWSEWARDTDSNQWGRYRLSYGEYEYEWQNPQPSSSSASKGKGKKAK